jgi:hypothetical protein
MWLADSAGHRISCQVHQDSSKFPWVSALDWKCFLSRRFSRPTYFGSRRLARFPLPSRDVQPTFTSVVQLLYQEHFACRFHNCPTEQKLICKTLSAASLQRTCRLPRSLSHHTTQSGFRACLRQAGGAGRFFLARSFLERVGLCSEESAFRFRRHRLQPPLLSQRHLWSSRNQPTDPLSPPQRPTHVIANALAAADSLNMPTWLFQFGTASSSGRGRTKTGLYEPVELAESWRHPFLLDCASVPRVGTVRCL